MTRRKRNSIRRNNREPSRTKSLPLWAAAILALSACAQIDSTSAGPHLGDDPAEGAVILETITDFTGHSCGRRYEEIPFNLWADRLHRFRVWSEQVGTAFSTGEIAEQIFNAVYDNSLRRDVIEWDAVFAKFNVSLLQWLNLENEYANRDFPNPEDPENVRLGVLFLSVLRKSRTVAELNMIIETVAGRESLYSANEWSVLVDPMITRLAEVCDP